ncbi:NAD-dependent epimerase/dehydratase family protein [Nocardia pseudovaccinii]|uniref:NAD-dependent epimerase/dehydratase family protein n=1 Tax=Nocardia pseudovaccinii TaxID=189540 RepID=UPI0007A427DD|nr:NAD-dependent epimerase/dehydratase family protein [Nocardia pseudovaccinii]
MLNAPRTIVVTGANSLTGRGLLNRLANSGARVIALVRTPVELPAAEVISDWTRSLQATEAIADASMVVHLSGVFAAADLDSYHAANVASTRRVVESINPAARLVYLSYVGADAEHDNWYIKTKGKAENLVRKIPDSVIFRIHPIMRGVETPSPFELMLRQPDSGAPVRVIGDGTQRFRPIHASNVIDAIINAARGIGEAGTYDLVGPSDLTITDMVEMVNGKVVPVQHLSVDQAAALPGPPATVVDVLANPIPSFDPEAAGRAFGLTLIRPEDTWPPVRPSSS